MRWRLWLYMAAAASLFVIPACFGRRGVKIAPPASGTFDVIKAVAMSDLVWLYGAVGLLVILLGMAMVLWRGKATGLLVAFCGAGLTYFGQTLGTVWSQVLSATVIVALCAVAAYLAFSLYKTKNVTAIVVGAVERAEHKAEVTGIIREKGPAVVKEVRKVVDPLKRGDGGGNEGT